MNLFKQTPRTTTIAPETTSGRTGPGTAKTGTPAVAPEYLALADQALGLISSGVRNAVAVARALLAANALDHQRIALIEEASCRELPQRMARMETRLEGIKTGVDALRAEVMSLATPESVCQDWAPALNVCYPSVSSSSFFAWSK